jgi:hypothetical protein
MPVAREPIVLNSKYLSSQKTGMQVICDFTRARIKTEGLPVVHLLYNTHKMWRSVVLIYSNPHIRIAIVGFSKLTNSFQRVCLSLGRTEANLAKAETLTKRWSCGSMIIVTETL